MSQNLFFFHKNHLSPLSSSSVVSKLSGFSLTDIVPAASFNSVAIHTELVQTIKIIICYETMKCKVQGRQGKVVQDNFVAVLPFPIVTNYESKEFLWQLQLTVELVAPQARPDLLHLQSYSQPRQSYPILNRSRHIKKLNQILIK